MRSSDLLHHFLEPGFLGIAMPAQDLGASESWELEEVDRKFQEKILNSYRRVREKVSEFHTDWRTAAYIVALSRLEVVYRERGIFQ